MDDDQITEPIPEPVTDPPILPTESIQEPIIVPETVIETEPRSEAMQPQNSIELTTETELSPVPEPLESQQVPVIQLEKPIEQPPTPKSEPVQIPVPIPDPTSDIRPSALDPTIPPEPRIETTQPRSDSESTTGAEPFPNQVSTPAETLDIRPSTLDNVDQGTRPSTFDVSTLSDTELKAAAALYTKRNQAEISRKGVAKRQETMELNLREIVDFLSLNNGSPLPRIAKHTNITLGTTSKYLRQLQSKGKVRAEGWAKTRRYYLK